MTTTNYLVIVVIKTLRITWKCCSSIKMNTKSWRKTHLSFSLKTRKRFIGGYGWFCFVCFSFLVNGCFWRRQRQEVVGRSWCSLIGTSKDKPWSLRAKHMHLLEWPSQSTYLKSTKNLKQCLKTDAIIQSDCVWAFSHKTWITDEDIPQRTSRGKCSEIYAKLLKALYHFHSSAMRLH